MNDSNNTIDNLRPNISSSRLVNHITYSYLRLLGEMCGVVYVSQPSNNSHIPPSFTHSRLLFLQLYNDYSYLFEASEDFKSWFYHTFNIALTTKDSFIRIFGYKLLGIMIKRTIASMSIENDLKSSAIESPLVFDLNELLRFICLGCQDTDHQV
jgi:hypothetical protein